MGSTFASFFKRVECTISICSVDTQQGENKVLSATSSNIKIDIFSAGYSPTNLSVKAGSVVNLTLANIEGYGCSQAFTIPKLGIQKTVPVGQTALLTFTAPKQKGELAFMCSMGMFKGVIKVV